MNIRQVYCITAVAVCIAAVVRAQDVRSTDIKGAKEVTIAFVAADGKSGETLENKQYLLSSPFGGWAVRAWPFLIRLDDKTILNYRTSEQKLIDQSNEERAVDDKEMKALLAELMGSNPSMRVVDLLNFRLDRPASETVEITAGEHEIKPFGIKFKVAQDESVTTGDTRLRVDNKAHRVEVVCHPVVIKTVAGNCSTSSAVQVSCGGTSLLGGFSNIFEEFDKMSFQEPGTSAARGFMRITLYLPSSAPGSAYEVNGVAFEVDANGVVKLAPGEQTAWCKDSREIILKKPARDDAVAQMETQPLGITWFGASGELTVSCGSASVIANAVLKEADLKIKAEGGKGSEIIKGSSKSALASQGSVWLPIPVIRMRTVSLGGMAVGVPQSDAGFPHAALIWDVANSACWAVDTAPLAAKPGAKWSCRIRRAAGNAPVPESLKVRLEGLVDAADGGEMALNGAGGTFEGTLPLKPGLWRLMIKGGGRLDGRPLGLVMIGEKETAPTISLFTVRNRGVIRRGDQVDVLWSAKLPAGLPAAEWPVVVFGSSLKAPVGKISMSGSAAGGAVSGTLRLDTEALAPGSYKLTVEHAGVASYPVQFSIIQKERLSDFEISSDFPIMKPWKPYPGIPVTDYKNILARGAGISPFLRDGDASLDASLASYANAPAGPVLENFNRPNEEELKLMATAAMGFRSMPAYPTLMASETENPKHSRPVDLQQMRRRMGLHMQKYCDFPGIDGFWLGWYASVWGFWEYTARLDGHQGLRSAAANNWAGARFTEAKKKLETEYKFDSEKLPEDQKKAFNTWVGAREWSQILPYAFCQWMVDAAEMRPGLTLHNDVPTWWLGGGVNYAGTLFTGMSHRWALDYTDYCIEPWSNFRIPPLLGMNNPQKQRIGMAWMDHSTRAEIVPMLFGAIGRSVDAVSMSPGNDQTVELLRICERFGSWFTALEPLPDVVLYCNSENKRATDMAFHDLARMRRPGMAVSPEDVLAGELSKYKVLFLLNIKVFEMPAIEKIVREFEAKGGIIIKDLDCGEAIPGRPLGFSYAKTNHGAWGLSSNGEWGFAVMWDGFKGSREKPLKEIFDKIPPIPVTTPIPEVIISPLAGKDSILCLVMNHTLVPTSLPGRWRQFVVLPLMSELQVQKGWFAHDVLAGKTAPMKNQSIPLDFTRFEGGIYLLTKREPKSMAIQTERVAADKVRLTGWLADSGGKPLADPMPFEVTLKGPDGSKLFHKFAALGPDVALEVPVPAMSAGAKVELAVRDLILGSTAVQALEPTAPAVVTARPMPDLIGGPAKIKAFLGERKGPVTIILDEKQDVFRPAAEKMAELLKKSGREARVSRLERADVLPLYLRWKQTKDDVEIEESLKDGNTWTWRIGLSPFAVEKFPQDDPRVGYQEYGPQLRHDADVVLFGSPANHCGLAQLEEYLRRVPTDAYPAPGGFFVHYLYSPFQGGYDGLYLGCRDAAGAEAAVATLAGVTVPAPVQSARLNAKPTVVRGGASAPLEDMIAGKFGTYVLDAAFTPSGERVFVTTTSYGDWFFTFNPAGELIEQKTPPTTPGFPNWYQWGRGWLRPVSENSLRIGLWNGDYLYDLKRGFLSRAAGTPSHMLPGPGDGGGPIVRASTRFQDEKTGVTYYGGNDFVYAVDKDGRLLWRYNDLAASGEVKYSRGTFPFSVSGNGKVVLVSAFGVAQALYATSLHNPSIIGIDAATGTLLWQKKNVFLNAGKVVALEDRFVVLDDNDDVYELMADSGKQGAAMSALTGSADWVVQVPGHNNILIIENDHFDRNGRTVRAYIRRLDGKGEKDLPVPGRVNGLTFTPDKKAFGITTTAGKTLHFAADGTLKWTAEIPASSFVKYSPDGRMAVVGTSEGLVHFLNAVDGKPVRKVDLNRTNVTTGEKFVKQELMGEVRQDVASEIPPPFPEPSYLTRFDPKKFSFSFGPNLMPPEMVRARLKPGTPTAADPAKPGYAGILAEPLTMTFKVEAGKTYMVEMLNCVADRNEYTPQLRMEISVKSNKMREQKNLPFMTRLPVGRLLSRQRTAFRADDAGEVTLTMRPVVPATTKVKERNKEVERLTYDNVPMSEIPVLLADIVVAAINFPGRNILFDAGPGAPTASQPGGLLRITMFPWENGTNIEKIPIKCPNIALRSVNGMIANQETAYGGRGGIENSEVIVDFKKPQKLSALIIFEDVAGPVPAGTDVRELTSLRYTLAARNAKTKQWFSFAVVYDNTQTFNIFPGPDCEVDLITGYWSGHHDWISNSRVDGAVRLGQVEAYAAEDVTNLLMEKLNSGKEDMPDLPPELGF